MIKLTEKGLKSINSFINEIEIKRKEILDVGLDTVDLTPIPTIEDIVCDIECFVDEDGDYYNGWGVTDDTKYDMQISLKRDTDFYVY